MRASLLNRSVAAAAFFAGGMVAAPAAAQPQQQAEQKNYSIPAQNLSSALQQLARQSGFQILYPSEVIEGRMSPATNGRMSWRDALDRMLAGSGLRFAGFDGETVVLTQVASRQSGTGSVPGDSDEIVVTAQVARQNALTRKRSSTNIRDVATADDVGKLPDQNLAEALGRLPGVSIERDKGEGRFVSIRGVEPGLNLVTIGGAPTAVPDVAGRAGRAAPLDVIGSGDFNTIEVIKTLRPDMDAQGLGGAINVLPTSAFDRPDRFGYATADYGVNDLESSADIYSGTAGLGTQLAGDTLGVFLGASYSKREYRTENVAGSNWQPFNDYFVPDRLRLQNFSSARERYGFTGNFQYRPAPGSEVFLRLIYNHFNEFDYRPEVHFDKGGSVSNQTPTSGTFSSGVVNLESLRQETDRSIFNGTGGLKQSFGADDQFLLEARFTYSRAKEDVPLFDAYEFNTATNQPITYDTSDYFFQFEAGDDRFDPANFVLDEFRIDTSDQQEELLVPAFDLTWNNSMFGATGSIKIGGQATLRDRFVNDNSTRYNNPGFTFDGFALPGPEDFFGGRYIFGPIPEQEALVAYLRANPDEFVVNVPRSEAQSVEDDYDLTENIYAGYAMATFEFDRLTLLGGLRVEYTDVSIAANQVVEFDGDYQGIEPREGSTEYTNVFPNLQARFEIANDLFLRAAYTKSMGRPDFVDAAPIATLEFDETEAGSGVYQGSLQEGNPELEPFLSDNLDLSIERYDNNGGLLAAALFYKDVANPIFERELFLQDVVRQSRTFEELQIVTTENAESGYILGLELTAQKQFTFLPGALSGLGISLNATFIDSEVTVFDRDDKLPFFRQPDRIYNGQLFYEFGPVQARLAYQYRSEVLETLGAEPEFDVYQDSSESLSAKIALSLFENLQIYAEGDNLTDEPFRRYQGDSSRVAGGGESGYEIFGRTFRFGLAGRF